MPKFLKSRLPRNDESITIQPGGMYFNYHPMASDSEGKKVLMCWPTLDNLEWLEDVKSFDERAETPTTVRYKNGKFVWFFKLACYHGGDGWWFNFDSDRSIRRAQNYRLIIPRTLQDHPDYEPDTQGE